MSADDLTFKDIDRLVEHATLTKGMRRHKEYTLYLAPRQLERLLDGVPLVPCAAVKMMAGTAVYTASSGVKVNLVTHSPAVIQ